MAADIRQISGGFEAEVARFEWLGQWQIAPQHRREAIEAGG
jgi:hypothetical protein